MALKDLKSDLSKFRKPVEKPLVDQKRVQIPTSTNQTPLSQFVDSTPSAPKSNLTTPKQGVNPNKFDNSSKFLGETSPTKFDNSSNYLGQTTPNKISLEERFLGQTTPNVVQQGDKFKGETTSVDVVQGDRFKGETSPQDYSNAEKFKGQTTPEKFRFVQQFLGETTQLQMSLSSQFLGETSPLKFESSTQFLGETTPVKFDSSTQFLGETTPIEFDSSTQFLGQTTPFKFSFNPNLVFQAKELKYVDFIENSNAVGFSPFLKHKSTSSFVGVNPTQTRFDNKNSLYGDFNGNFEGLSFKPGYREFKLSKETGNTQRYTPDGNKYEESYTSISKLMEQRSSPSFLDKMYAKYNLKDDSPNFLNIIRAPYILRGIQRKKITQGEPQFWDFGLGIDDGFIRGGIVASTVRAVADTLRLGAFFLSVKGLLWAVRQFGSQRTNKYGTLWTPINLLATTLGQHIGFRPSRHGLFPGDPTGVYKNTLVSGYDDKLLGLYSDKLANPIYVIGLPFTTQAGGFDSLYGIGLTNTTRFSNTFGGVLGNMNFKSFGPIGEEREYNQKFNPWSNLRPVPGQESEPDYENIIPRSGTDEYLKFGVANQTIEQSPIPIDTANKGEPTAGVAASSLERKANINADIVNYQAISYGEISKRANNTAGEMDFRTLYGNVPEKNILGGTDYSYDKQSREAKYKLPKPLARDKKTFAKLFGADSTKYDASLGNADSINSSLYNNTLQQDFVHLFFAYDRGDGTADLNRIIQFRGTVNGITETFSPSWNGIKYPGRADKSYMYEEFERTLSFNFKAYAQSRSEMKTMWQKIATLAKLTLPTYGSNTYTGHICYFRLGQLWGNGTAGIPTLITSLTYTIPDDMSWELNQDGELAELAMGMDIAVSLTILPTENYYESSNSVYSFESLPKFA
jgi:hypothetical protein